MKFFFDNNLSMNLTQGMKSFGEDVVHLKEIFPEETDDTEWLKYIGEKKLILITRDLRVRQNPVERNALLKYKVGAFFLGGKNLDRCKIIRQVVKNWPRIKEYASKTKPPFACLVHGSRRTFLLCRSVQADTVTWRCRRQSTQTCRLSPFQDDLLRWIGPEMLSVSL